MSAPQKTKAPLTRLWPYLATMVLTATPQLACKKQDQTQTRPPSRMIISDIALEEPDCSDCGARLAKAIEQSKGVISVNYHSDSQELTVSYDPDLTSPKDFVDLAHSLGIHASEGVGSGVSEPEIDFPPEMDVRVISKAGEMVVLDEYIAANKVTVFDFRAVWCGPCREVDRELKELARAGTVFALRILDVSDWDSPVARAYLEGVDGLPHLIIVSADGEKRTVITGLNTEAMDAAIKDDGSGGADRGAPATAGAE